MVLRFAEGFENRQSGTYLDRLYSSRPSTVTFVAGRKHGAAMSANLGALRTRELVTTDENTWLVGFAVRLPNEGSLASSTAGLSLRNADGEQCKLHIIQGGDNNRFKVELRRDVTVIATSTIDFGKGNRKAWHYFQLSVTVRTASNGDYELRHWDYLGNQQTVLSGSGVNLAHQAVDGADRVEFSFATSGGGSIYLDDLVVMDSTGSVNNALVTVPFVVMGMLPQGAGNSSDFQVVGAGSNFQAVDDPVGTPNDSDYVQSFTSAEQDLYDFAPLSLVASGSATVIGLHVVTTAQMRASGSQDLAVRVRSGGSEASSSAFTVGVLSARSYSVPLDQNPIGPAAWTKSSVEAAEFGPVVS